MALNKYMHPRNVYKNPPDFAILSKTFREFSSISKTDITGKVTIDFKDPKSLRILTKCLLKSDFNLDVDIPEDRLVPTLPLRLNYILWIEDLLNSIQRNKDVRGLDIGTGSCAIYPLLAAATNKWHFIGTETNEGSLQKAMENVQKNNLGKFINIVKNPTTSVIDHLFGEYNGPTLDFCMCNPPFYSNVEELCESRSTSRVPPKNGFTGSPHELITEGGELEFCRKLIKESKDHKRKILIFTTMVGHKYNLKELMEGLKSEDIMHTSTEFCQGRVTRWGLAWTYEDYKLNELLPSRNKTRKKNVPMVYLLPELPNTVYDVQTLATKIKSILNDLKITYKVLNKRVSNMSLNITAATNTWSAQRRKRRLMNRLENTESKKHKVSNLLQTSINQKQESHKTSKDKDVDLTLESNIVEKNTSQTCGNNLSKEKCSNNNIIEQSKSNIPVVQAFLKILKKENDIILEMEYIGGSAGKEGLHQIFQYIKNNWK